jgi:hypothetical protein
MLFEGLDDADDGGKRIDCRGGDAAFYVFESVLRRHILPSPPGEVVFCLRGRWSTAMVAVGKSRPRIAVSWSHR